MLVVVRKVSRSLLWPFPLSLFRGDGALGRRFFENHLGG